MEDPGGPMNFDRDDLHQLEDDELDALLDAEPRVWCECIPDFCDCCTFNEVEIIDWDDINREFSRMIFANYYDQDTADLAPSSPRSIPGPAAFPTRGAVRVVGIMAIAAGVAWLFNRK